MSDLAWRAEGIQYALACGGIVLEKYRRVGFAGGTDARVSGDGYVGSGLTLQRDPAEVLWQWEMRADPEPPR